MLKACPDCKGGGSFPPEWDARPENLPWNPSDSYRFFPRPCGRCGGAGKVADSGPKSE